MKKIRKLILTGNADQLNDREMKMIVGGYSSSCYWESPKDRGCTNDPTTASFMGVSYWCCNCDEARKKC